MSLFCRLLPHHCPLCLNRCFDYICQDCIADLTLIPYGCDICGLPLSSKTTHCSDCLIQPKPYTRTVSPLLYAHPVDTLIRQFKSQSPLIIARQLAPFLTPHINTLYNSLNLPDTLIPVPLHWYSKLKRGFNQAHCLADVLSQMTGIDCQPIVRRQHKGLIQKSLGRKQRLTNLRNTFSCTADLHGQHVVIIDDVITTGATAISMSNVLLAAGARRVDVWALARTPQKGENKLSPM